MYEVGEEATIDSIDGAPEEESQTPQLSPTDAERRFVELWINRIKKSRRTRRGFYDLAKKAVQRYTLDEESADGGENVNNYPLFWSNTQVMRGAMYTSTPIPDVRRRNVTENFKHTSIAVALERGLEYMLDTSDFDGNLNRALIDYLVAGMAQARIVYDAEVEDVPIIDPKTGEEYHDDYGEVQTMPEMRSQRIWIEHVPYEQFDWDGCIRWEDCQWVSFAHWLEKRDIRDQFAIDTELTSLGESKVREGKTKYKIYEIWDKRFKRVIFLADGLSKPLKISDDVLGLQNFFPCPKPMMANVNPTKFVPTPEYSYYTRQELQIDRLTRRIHNLTANSTIDRGFYDAGVAEELDQLANSNDGEYIPVPNLRQKLMAAGGSATGNLFENVMAVFPIENVARVIQILQQQRESELQHVYQITGISDIMRGYSKASETLGAQEIKQASASNRISVHRKLFDNFIRDTFRIVSDVCAGHLTPETWLMMTGIQIDAEMEDLMRDSVLLNYVVDIETDSTVQQPSDYEKKMTLEAVSTVTQTLGSLLPMMGQGLSGDVVKQLLSTTMKPFKVAREFEQVIQQIPSTQQQMEQMQQQLGEAQQQTSELNAQLQQAMEKIAQFDYKEQARKDAEVQAEVVRDRAQSSKLVEEGKTEESVRMLNIAKANDLNQPDRKQW